MAFRFQVCDFCDFRDFCFLLFRTEWSWWFCHFQILFSVFFRILKKTLRPEIRTPNTWTLKSGTLKTRYSICWNPHYQDSKTWCRILKTNVKRRVIFAISIQFIRCLRLFKNVCKKVLLCENWNPGQNIWHKVTKYSKIGQDFKNVISYFACFLTAIVNV